MRAERGIGLFTSLIGALGLLVVGAGAVRASDESNTRAVSVTINAGETYVIKNLSDDDTPAVHVINNPNALIIHSDAPGQLVLLGTSAGEWSIEIKTAGGEKVKYDVSVKAIASPFSNPLAPGKAPPAIGAPKFAADKPIKAALPIPATAPVETSSSATLPPASSPRAVSAAPAGNPTAAEGAASAPLTAVSSSGPVTQSQSMAGEPPPEKFKADPMAVPVSPSESHASGTNFLPNDVVVMMAGSSRIFDFPRRLRRLSIADTDIADLQVINPFQINLIAHKSGFTTLAVWDNQGHYDERQIRVDPYGKQQVMLNVIVAELNRGRLEQQGINWSVALSRYNISLLNILGNGPATPFSASSNINASGQQGSSTGSTLPFGGEVIPLLLSPNITYALAAQNNDVLTQSLFQFLEQHNLAKILSEPRLLANSGEKAEFLSGGEIPIVIAQALNTSIVFKQFGTSVIFVPTVVGKDDIELEVKPEVSQPDFTNGVSLFGFTVPAFVTRRAQTFVRLRNNQTLIIAGLLLRTKTEQVSKVPYLGDMPYLGRLFKNTSYNETDSDLVMTVTPQIVQPLPANGQPAIPTDRGPLTDEEIRTRRLATPDAARPRF